MPVDYDYIVIGSGFGGSVMSCRLVEKGYDVCLLERGRQWKMHEFPRRPQEIQQNLFWKPQSGKFGLMEVRDFPESDAMTLTASGLGGGSLIYANVLYKMPTDFFKGWPAPYRRELLDPYYDKVLSMMETSPYPTESQTYYKNTPKTSLLKKIAEELELPEGALRQPEFVMPPLAVRFSGDFPGHQTPNKHGALQSRCNKCGECDIGCNIHAKNTLDLNYIFKAKKTKAQGQRFDVRTHAEVTRIEHKDDYYLVTFVIPEFPLKENSFRTKKVIVAAGSVGSTTLLLKMRKEGYLPKLNQFLGKRWSGNGDHMAFVFNTDVEVDPTVGPVITGAIEYRYRDYADGYPHGLYLQEAGFPTGMAWYLSGKVPQLRGIAGAFNFLGQNIKKYIQKILRVKSSDDVNVGHLLSDVVDRGEFTKRTMVLLGMGRDRPDGEISLRKDNQAIIRWTIKNSQLHFDRMREEMRKIAKKVGGTYVENPIIHMDKVISVHPLGGCPMGESPQTGFVSPEGEVFGYPGLFVVDGSIMPTSTGPNPSLTIAAVAERIADSIPAKKSLGDLTGFQDDTCDLKRS